MLVSGSGKVKLSKDGNVLLGEMQIQHPTAAMIARAATAIDEITGDGTTSTVLLIGNILRQCEEYITEGVHARVVTSGIESARVEALKFLNGFKKELSAEPWKQKDILIRVAHTAIATKVNSQLAKDLSTTVVDAIQCVHSNDKPIDLHMIEIMHMRHRTASDTQFVNGIVLDHGARHESMPKKVDNAYILTCNVSLEYERAELGANFFYSDPSKKEAMAVSEHKITDDRVQQIIDLKRQLKCNLVVINQKGIDPIALEMLAGAGILALRRAKRRNMERLVLSCGGEAVNSFENLSESCLGFAESVYETTLGEEKYTFVENARGGSACTILVKGPNDHTIAQTRDAVNDGLKSVKNAIEDHAVIPGAGCFEVACSQHLMRFSNVVQGKQKIGVKAFAQSLLCIPKTLLENSGLDTHSSLIELQSRYANETDNKNAYYGLDLETGMIIDPEHEGVWDNFIVKRNVVDSSAVIASQILLVDEIVKVGHRGVPR
ncbi:chaperonin TCP20 [Perkinsela sp. CCAP 1560/4]|nr:chaperonin TCP20 [Perkinsela sp. CCAP 1560/4]|eukprot:KNH01735.1 chaperonin TCP20 [Perkinsela sp. CCAP 1560/4]